MPRPKSTPWSRPAVNKTNEPRTRLRKKEADVLARKARHALEESRERDTLREVWDR